MFTPKPTGFILALLLILAAAAHAGETITRPFRGVRDIHCTGDNPRRLDFHVLEIDLKDPEIRFRVTPPNGPDVPGETTLETTRAFLRRTGAQIAVNCSFFKIESLPFVDNINLAVAAGVQYSTFTGAMPALNISRDKVATIVTHDPRDTTGYAPLPPVKLWNAIGGNERILKNGANVAVDKQLHPRTAAGITAAGKLLLLVADGRNPDHSMGMTTLEVADALKAHGAVDALNLDGGGSSTLVFADPAPRVVNVPVGFKDIPGTERPVGINLAIYAAPAGSKTIAQKPETKTKKTKAKKTK